MTRRLHQLFGIVAVAALALPAFGNEDDKDATKHESEKEAKDAKTFIKQAARDNGTEIRMAQLGLRKGQNQAVKDFSQQLVEDHTKLAANLKPVAQKCGVDLNSPEVQVKANQFAKLEKLSGAEFDKRFAEDALRHHQKDVTKYEKASRDLEEADVNQFIQSTLPKLRQHLTHAAEVARTVGVDQSTISSIMKKSPDAVGGTGDKTESTEESGTGNKQGSGAEDLKKAQ